jgi:GPH family glycoside/pentoside/hexuronide:cation symporter
MTIYAIWNAANNPILGHMSDRTRSRWGRHLPDIRFGVIPYATICRHLVCAVRRQNPAYRAAIWFLVTIVVFEGFGTAVTVAGYQASCRRNVPNLRIACRSCGTHELAPDCRVVYRGGVATGTSHYPRLPVDGRGICGGGRTAYFIGLRGMYEQPSYVPTELPFWDAVKNTLVNRSFVSVMLAQMMRFVSTNTLTSGMFFWSNTVCTPTPPKRR